MLDYARARAQAALSAAHSAVLATAGPAGVLAGEFPCEARGLSLYLLLPQTSDHLFNLEHDQRVALLTEAWELRGTARTLAPDDHPAGLHLLQAAATACDVLVKVAPARLQVRRPDGWGPAETLDITPA